jgi:hypothetical protein
MSAQVEVARQQWHEGHRRFQAAADDPLRYERLAAHVAVLTGELRRRIGQVFTLGELADEYTRAEAWSRDVADEAVPLPGPADLATAEDAAFHLYARAARDFDP